MDGIRKVASQLVRDLRQREDLDARKEAHVRETRPDNSPRLLVVEHDYELPMMGDGNCCGLAIPERIVRRLGADEPHECRDGVWRQWDLLENPGRQEGGDRVVAATPVERMAQHLATFM